MLRGVIKFYSEDRGYGFISTEERSDARDELYVHYSQIQGSSPPHEGQAVVFEVKDGDRGPEAVNVKVVS